MVAGCGEIIVDGDAAALLPSRWIETLRTLFIFLPSLLLPLTSVLTAGIVRDGERSGQFIMLRCCLAVFWYIRARKFFCAMMTLRM